MRSIVISTYGCVFVCLSARISLEPHARSLTMRMLPMAVARSSSGVVVIRYVLPVLVPCLFGSVAQGLERRSLAGELSLSCAQHVVDG